MTINLDVQIVSKNTEIPKVEDFEYWAKAVPSEHETSACLRVVDESEAKSLNKQFRQIHKATNVLSFAAEIPPQIGIKFLGDIVICAQVVVKETQEQGKQLSAHWAHLLIHGLLHLQGYDHEEDQEARVMEAHEIEILKNLDISNPYN